MVYDRGGYYNRSEEQDYGRDYGSGRDHSFSSARDYAAAGELGRGRGGYDRERMGRGGYDDRRFDDRSSGYYQGGGEPYRGSYAHDGRRFAEQGGDDDRDYGRERGRGFMGAMGGQGRDRDHDRDRGYGSRGGRDDDGGFLSRAGDEVRSWFGDDDAERRRSMDDERDTRRISGNWGGDRVHDHRDRHYYEWRQSQISQLDRDYDEYRREHQSKFDNEFSSWRTTRQSQRQMVRQVQEHAEVFGSDGERVGTVDKVQGDRIKLTRNDPEAGGHHHSIPCGWIQSVEGNRVTLNKSSIEAKTMWRDEEYQDQGRSMFGGGAETGGREHNRSDEGGPQARDNQGRILNRSFTGTYDEQK
jgi:hypothetical protein